MYRENHRKGQETEKVIIQIRDGDKIIRLSLFRKEEKLYTPIQKHTDKVIELRRFPEDRKVGDAVITSLKGVEIGVRTADCVPIVLVGERWAGVIHAGWRGLLKGIVEKTVERLGKYEKSIRAYLFPSARSCCYEVGEEFLEFFPDRVIKREGKLFFDPQEEALKRLIETGVNVVFRAGECTICSAELPSYRRDKTPKRMLTSVLILPDRVP